MTERREIKQRSPAVWARAREAYLAGEPAASVARRFDVGYGNLRFRAHAEGWTRKAVMAGAEAEAAAEARRIEGRADPEAHADPSPVDPGAARRSAIERAGGLLAAGRAAEATALLKAAEAFGRMTEGDADPSERPPAPMSPEADAAREAAGKAAWDEMNAEIESRAARLAHQLLTDAGTWSATYGHFALRWRAEVLGPEIAAEDRKRAEDPLGSRRPGHHGEKGRDRQPTDRGGPPAHQLRSGDTARVECSEFAHGVRPALSPPGGQIREARALSAWMSARMALRERTSVAHPLRTISIRLFWAAAIQSGSMSLVGVILSAGVFLGEAQEVAYCRSPDESVYALDYNRFDSAEGWRAWGEHGCLDLGADILARYRQLNAGALQPWQVAGLQWHEGQLRAASGDYGAAIALLADVRKANIEGSPVDYEEATLAFLRADYEGLLKARDRMRAEPEPPDFSRAADRYVAQYQLPRPVWPMNMDVVEDMVRCFGRPYREAYGGCSPRDR